MGLWDYTSLTRVIERRMLRSNVPLCFANCASSTASEADSSWQLYLLTRTASHLLLLLLWPFYASCAFSALSQYSTNRWWWSAYRVATTCDHWNDKSIRRGSEFIKCNSVEQTTRRTIFWWSEHRAVVLLSTARSLLLRIVAKLINCRYSWDLSDHADAIDGRIKTFVYCIVALLLATRGAAVQ